jgi:hypothetical protein
MCFCVIALLMTPLGVRTAQVQETTMVPVMIDGQTVHLEIRIYKPSTDAKALTLVFNHGSTGRGRAPSLFTQARDFP